MPHRAIVVFTAKPADQIVADGGSGDWRLDPQRARQAEYLVCTQNQHHTGPVDPAVGPPRAPHGAAFLIARIYGVTPSPAEPKRWMINIREYAECMLLNIWRKSGQIHLRYPVWYTTLEDVGIDLATLPPFRPLPHALAHAPLAHPPSTREALAHPPRPNELSEAAMPLLVPPRARTLVPGRAPQHDRHQAQARLDAILAQLDRIPDLPAPGNPLDWDEHGVPR